MKLWPLSSTGRTVSLWGNGWGFKSLRGYFIWLAYDGRMYRGLIGQEQSIRYQIIMALKKLDIIENISFSASSRTDAKVSANSNLIYLKIRFRTNNIEQFNLQKYLNRQLPYYIRVLKFIKVKNNILHREFKTCVMGKIYKYRISWNNDILGKPKFQIQHPLNQRILSSAIRLLTYQQWQVEWWNFCSYEKKKNMPEQFYKRHIFISLHNNKNGIYFKFMGKGFLSHQIRRIIGFILSFHYNIQENYQKSKVHIIQQYLHYTRNRNIQWVPTNNISGTIAPGCGLTLEKQVYNWKQIHKFKI